MPDIGTDGKVKVIEVLVKAGDTIAEMVGLALDNEFVPFAVNVSAGEVSETTKPFLALAERMKGDVRFRSDMVESMKGIPHAYELTWNHTTLRALKLDTNITYLQVQYPGPDHVEKVRIMTELFPDEVIGHLEFIKFDGQIQCAGLPLVRYTTKERLEEIIRIHEENGCPIFNPHRYTLEEGGMKQTDEVQLAFKREADPKGLLNPGKMIAWENPDFDFSAGKNYLFPGLEVFSEAS